MANHYSVALVAGNNWTSDARGITKLSRKAAQAAQPDCWAARNFNKQMLKEVMCIYILCELTPQ